jgi:hypothetical protein
MVLRRQAELMVVPTSGAITSGLTFGRFLRFLREQEYPRISQSAVVAKLQKLTKAPYDRTMYSRVENDTAYPSFDLLYFLYVALRELRVPISSDQCQLFLRLARERLASKMTHQEHGVEPADWEQLRHKIEAYERKFPSPLLLERRAAPARYVREAFLPDVRQVVGREAWLDDMVQHLLAPLAPKLVIVQGSLGAGKSCALHALGWRLKQVRPDDPPTVSLIEFDAKAPEPDEEAILDQFLCAVLTDLGAVAAIEVMKLGKTLEERIAVAFEALEHVQRSIVLVDNAEMVIDANSAIAALWQQFLSSFLRRNHRLTLILATKEWPGWYGDASFVLESQLPSLSPQTGAAVLRRAGFASAPEELLMRVSDALSNHPEAILWFARLARRKVFHLSYSGQGGAEDLVCLEGGTDAGDIQALERALRDPHLFAGAATAMLRPLLSRVISRRLSQRAQHLLELLAVARLALLPDALEVVFEDLYELHAQLESASLLVAHQNRYQLLPLVIAAGNQRISAIRREELEQHLIAVYQAWVEMGIFSSEREQGQVITELALLLLKHHRFLPAAELIIQYGWLSFDLGYGVPLARRAYESMKQFDWKEGLGDEVGGLLLRAVLARYLGENLQARERKDAYQRVYELATTGRVELKARTRVHLVHHILRYLVAQDRYAEALILIDEACTGYGELRETEPISYAELLDNKAYVQGRWGDSLAAQARDLSRRGDHLAADRVKEEAVGHWEPCVAVHHQCVALLRQCERMASPLERSHIKFKLAKFLNDVSYYQRCLGDLEAAAKAMQGCLELKEAGYSWPNSLAVSYGNWAQLLAAKGCFRQALDYRGRALQIVERMIEQGDNALLEEKGMQLIEGGEISLLLGRFEEARQSFEEGMRLVGGTGRRYYIDQARDGLRAVEEQLRDNPQRQLDWRWFPTYHRLASFDAIHWLSQAAGPFTVEEQEEWDELGGRYDDEATKKRVSALVAQSRKRELAACLEGGREPHFHYPAIPVHEIQTRANEFMALREAIARGEKNSVVRRLYLEAIDERLDEIHLVEAAARGDDEAFWACMQRLFAKPTPQEMTVAIRELTTFAQRGLRRSETREVSQDLLRLLQQWRAVPAEPPRPEPDRGEEDLTAVDNEQQHLIPGQNGQRLFSPGTVRRFFDHLFHEYGIPYQAVLDPISTSERIDHNLRKLFLPAEKWVSLARIREMLAHEFEQHIFRALNGARSPLALLSSGTRGYLETEEGLATYYALEVSRLLDPQTQPKLWIGTLATGLASGAICPPLPFSALYQVFRAIKLLTDLLAGKQASRAKLLEDAHTYAQNRCLRTFRGVSDLTRQGICSTKDILYQRGYFAVAARLQEDPTRFDRLMVGAVGLHQLDDLAELGIIAPPTSHRRLATALDLERYVMQFAEDPAAGRGSAESEAG